MGITPIIVGVPIYEYRCSGCDRPSTALLPAWSSPDPACPHCGRLGLQRQVSSFATARSESGDGFDGADFGEGDDYGGPDDGGDGGDFDGGGFDDDF